MWVESNNAKAQGSGWRFLWALRHLWTTAAPPSEWAATTILPSPEHLVAASYAFSSSSASFFAEPVIDGAHTIPQPRVSARRQYVSNGYCRVDQTPTPSKPPPGTSSKQGAACLVAPLLNTLSLYSSPRSSSARRGAPFAPSSAFVLTGFSEGARNVFVGSKTSTDGSLINSLHRGQRRRSGGSARSISSQSTHTQLWPQPTKRTARGASKQILHSRRSSSSASLGPLMRGSAVRARALCGASGVRRGGGAGAAAATGSRSIVGGGGLLCACARRLVQAKAN